MHFEMVYPNIKQNLEFVDLKCVTYTQPIRLSLYSKCLNMLKENRQFDLCDVQFQRYIQAKDLKNQIHFLRGTFKKTKQKQTKKKAQALSICILNVIIPCCCPGFVHLILNVNHVSVLFFFLDNKALSGFLSFSLDFVHPLFKIFPLFFFYKICLPSHSQEVYKEISPPFIFQPLFSCF